MFENGRPGTTPIWIDGTWCCCVSWILKREYPEDNVLSRNLTYLCGRATYEPGTDDAFSYYAEIQDNLYEQDPLFVDENGGDMSLSPESPAFTIPGFEDIPFDQIGIQP